MSLRTVAHPTWALICSLTFAVAAVTIEPADWKYSQKLALNTTVTGASVADDVADFPLLVRLSNDNFAFDDAMPNGEDLCFVDPDGQVLPSEIELWDRSAGVAAVWVRVPIVDGGSDRDFVSMHWGNPTAQPTAHPLHVFGSDNGFIGVWHLSQAATGVGAEAVYLDATGGGRDGLDNVNATAKTGVVGLGQHFDKAAGDHIVVPPPPSDTREFTLSAWVYADAVRMDWDASNGDLRQQWIVGDFAWWPQNGIGVQFFGTQLVGLVTVPGNKWFYQPGVLTARKWTHIAFTRSANGLLRLYSDGNKVAEFQAPSDAIPSSGSPMLIASPSATGGFDGNIDEIQHSAVSRSDAWLRLSYENQRPNQSLIQFRPSDIVLQAGTSVDGLDGALVRIHAGSVRDESGAITLLPGHTESKSQRVSADVRVGTENDPRGLRTAFVTGYEGVEQGADLSLRGGSGANAGGLITVKAGNATSATPDAGGGDIVLMPGGTSPTTPALPGSVIIGDQDRNRNLRVNGSILLTGTLYSNGVAYSPSQWRAGTSAGIGYAGPVAIGGLDPSGYMLRVEGSASVNGEIMSTSGASHYLVYTQKDGRNSGLFWDESDRDIELWTNTAQRLAVKSDGRVGIGTNEPGVYQLAVEGSVGCRELVVTLDRWADDVFDTSYALPSLDELREYLRTNRHLPGVPTAAEVIREGVSVGRMQETLLRKIEELTLYVLKLRDDNIELRRQLTCEPAEGGR